ncbi:MAG: cytidylate kinase family protein, partial [Eubacteriales bacterium]|nr:cytidylate kinase family protein [Eubacteriales bacterium]
MSNILCLGRQFGSGGHTIAKRVAEKLEMEYYDKFLLEHAIIRSGLPRMKLEKAEERVAPFMYEERSRKLLKPEFPPFFSS